MADFGLSHMLTFSITLAPTTGGVKGTVRWMSIELFTGDEQNPFTKEADIWALGMTFYVRRSNSILLLHLIMLLLSGNADNAGPLS